MSKRHEIRLCGYGGQGIVRAGYIIGQAASLFDHKHTTFTQSYGPEARGGSCRADVVISDERVLYPYISTPSVLIAMSQEAYNEYYPQTSKDTLVIIDEDLIKPEAIPEKRLLAVPARRIAEELGRVAMANAVMLGFLAAVTDFVSVEAMRKSILSAVPEGTTERNMAAFEHGYTCASKKLDSDLK